MEILEYHKKDLTLLFLSEDKIKNKKEKILKVKKIETIEQLINNFVYDKNIIFTEKDIYSIFRKYFNLIESGNNFDEKHILLLILKSYFSYLYEMLIHGDIIRSNCSKILNVNLSFNGI